MLRLYGCLVEQHDLRLVGLAALVCVLACAVAVDMLGRARQSVGQRQRAWSALGAATFACGVWATHFVAELAYAPGIPLGYAPGLTILSIVVALALAALGSFVALRYDAPLAGGAVLGAAVGAMHYTGMAALRAPAIIRWDVVFVLSSLAIGMTFCAAAMRALWSGSGLRPRLVATGLLVAAITGLHFTAMAAVTLNPDPRIDVVAAMVAPKVLASGVAAVTAAIMAAGIIGLIADQRLARRAAWESERLRGSEARLIDAIEALPAGFALYDADGRFVLCNTRYRAIYAESADLMQPGTSFADIVRIGAERGHYKLGEGGVEAWVNDRLARWANPGPPFEQQLGTGEWVRVSDRRTSEGGMIGVREDITELKQREATLRALFASNPLPMMVYDVKTLRFLEVNDAAIGHYGYGRDAFLAMTLTQLLAPESREQGDKPSVAASHGGLRHRKADGSAIIVEVTSHQLTFEGRNAALMVAIDVTDKCRAEEEARASAARLGKSERHLARAQELAEVGSFEGDLDTGEMVWSDNL
ncbi:MAG TPA: MHYT domain-containing protein, partial [Stellaceae bacterium]|nr:MHYT domain-containing protein [Stellaceae bacterium]